ncbi:hypothetical protein [Egbenema bharatensis]|uniref:hypothetical protein n=1 Tax=Egbenema bharatensis TaxID=3463334 RepID=UPI003A852912
MTYGDRLRRWVVVRLLPKMQRVDVARFYHCSDAEGYVQVLRQLDPEHQYEVMFDPGEPEGDRSEE